MYLVWPSPEAHKEGAFYTASKIKDQAIGGLNPTSFRKRNNLLLTHYQVIQHSYVDAT